MSLLSVREAARHAGVSESLIYQLCDERRLPHYRPGGKGKRGKILIDPRDLDAFMASCRIAAEAQPQVKAQAPKAVGAFQNLDAGRLLSAWQQQGVLRDHPDVPDNARSS